MKNHMKCIVTLCSVFLVGLASVLNAQEVQKAGMMNFGELLATLKAGQWVKLEGALSKASFVIQCTEVEILTGDFTDDDWEIVGIARWINPEKQQFKIVNLTINVDKEAGFESSIGKFKGFGDLRVGMLIEAEGTYLKDGTFLAKELENESQKLKEKPELKDEVELVGRIGSIDVANRVVEVMGMTFQLSERTKGKSVIK